MGLVALWRVGSSQARARTHVPCIGRRILNHCATRGAPTDIYFSPFWSLGSPGSRCQYIRFLVRTCFLTYRHLPSHDESAGLSSSSYKDTNPIVEVPPSWPHLNLISSQRPHLQIPSNLGFRFQHNQFGDGGYEPSAHNSDTSGIIHYIAFWVSAKCIWDSMMLLCQ